MHRCNLEVMLSLYVAGAIVKNMVAVRREYWNSSTNQTVKPTSKQLQMAKGKHVMIAVTASPIDRSAHTRW